MRASTCTPTTNTDARKPWIRTPLLESNALSQIAGCKIFMKMEMFQPAGSFKSRGIGNYCCEALASRPSNSASRCVFYCSSGGNAGLAAATTAKALGHDATVVVPETTSTLMKNKITTAGGRVITYGASWKEADEYIRELMAHDTNGVYCPPFDHPDIWEGNATLIDEVIEQLGCPPDAIIASVGGGGLLCGIQLGLERHHLQYVPVLAVETVGAHSLNASLQAGEIVTLSAITSIATSLGARRVAEKAFQLGQSPNVLSEVLTDSQAMMGSCRLMDDERIAVEAACGVSAAVIYDRILNRALPELHSNSKVVLVICGGSNVNVELLHNYRNQYESRN